MMPCFLDMLHVSGIWPIRHDIMLLTCVSLVIRTRGCVSSLQLPMSPCRLYCPITLSHFPRSSCSYMIRYMLLSDTSHVLVVPGTLDMTSCFRDMLHVGGIWRIGHDLMLLTCVSFVYHFMTSCFVLFSVLAPLYNHLSPTALFPKHMHSCHWYQHDHTCWWVLVHGTWHDVLSPFSVLAPLYTH